MVIASIIFWAYYIISIFVIISLLLENREFSSTLVWIFLILFLPYAGLIIYFIFGRKGLQLSRKRKKEERQMRISLTNALSDYANNQKNELQKLDSKGLLESNQKIINLLSNNPESFITSNNDVEIFNSGKEKFEVLYNDLQNAKKFIHMAYYIWEDDFLTKRFVKLLKEKVKEGVEIRILYDSLGSFGIKRKYIKDLRKFGINIRAYSSYFSSAKPHTINYRNHLKLVVIDGDIGYTGGMNMSQEYVDGGKHFKSWRDTHIKIQGDCVDILNSIFSFFWYKMTSEKLDDKKYYLPFHKNKEGVSMQVVGSGIDINWSAVENVILNLINRAKKSILITTPYFVPSESVLTALKIAALSGINVKIIMSGIPYYKITNWASYTFFPELLKCGVEIYLYQKGYLHSKVIIVDEEVSSVGTVNMDIRSFKLNYELSVVMYNKKVAKFLESVFEKDLLSSIEYTLIDDKNLGFFRKLRNSFLRLFTPIL
jgi:cardiolipin synthase